MANLWSDLDRYADEYYTRRDLKAGIKLVVKSCGEILGLVGVVTVTFQLLSIASGVLAPLGLTLSSAMMARLVMQAANSYIRASTEERKQIRTAMRWLRGGFSLGDRLLD